VSLRWYSVAIDSHDIAAQARWWADVLGWEVDYESGHEVWIVPPGQEKEAVDGSTWALQRPALCFVAVPEGKTVKNRLHLDLAPWVDDDHAATVDAVIAKGATRVDVGQDPDPSKTTWAVLADPEGNEFCILSSRGE
jgi:catechol 2,3-dioxygenase-like lactoylglutathione lyase family enzyme